MTIKIEPELEVALTEHARRLGVPIETWVTLVLKEKLAASVPPIEPRDDWERRLLAIGSDCGVSLSNAALSSEGLYE